MIFPLISLCNYSKNWKTYTHINIIQFLAEILMNSLSPGDLFRVFVMFLILHIHKLNRLLLYVLNKKWLFEFFFNFAEDDCKLGLSRNIEMEK